jgi:hypothetical protein
MDVSTNESNHLLVYPIPNNYNNAKIELTNLDPRENKMQELLIA